MFAIIKQNNNKKNHHQHQSACYSCGKENENMSLQFWVLLLIILWNDAQIRLVVSIADSKYRGESQMEVVQPPFSFSATVSKNLEFLGAIFSIVISKRCVPYYKLNVVQNIKMLAGGWRMKTFHVLK